MLKKRRPCLLLGLLAALLISGACAMVDPGKASDAEDSHGGLDLELQQEMTQRGRPRLCELTPSLDCQKLASGQWIAVDGKPSTEGVVLIDAGGPGASGSESLALRSLLPASLSERAAVLVFEPWTYRPWSALCRAELAKASWQDMQPSADTCPSVVQNLQSPGAEFLFDEVERALNAPISSIVANSFGATRSAPLWERLNSANATLIVVSPAPPPGTEYGSLAAARSQQVVDLLNRSGTRGCGAKPCMTGRQLVLRLATESAYVGVPSVELSMFLLAASSDPEPYSDIVTALLSGASMDRQAVATVRRLALSFSRTVDEGRSLPTNGGFRAAMCQAYLVPKKIDPSSDPLVRALAHQVGPCTGVVPLPAGLPTSVPDQSCLVLNGQDAVAPIMLTSAYAELFGKQRTVVVSSPEHDVVDEVLPTLNVTDTGCTIG